MSRSLRILQALFESVVVDSVQSGEIQPNDRLGRLHYTVEAVMLCSCAAGIPHANAVGQDEVDGASVEVAKLN